jgi:hypothetical protein
MLPLSDSNDTFSENSSNEVRLSLKQKLKQGWVYFKDEFKQHKLNKLKVVSGDNLGERLGKQSATVLLDGAYLVVHLVKLPTAIAVKGYHAVTQNHASCYPLESLEQRSLLQRLTDIGVYSVALPFDAAKGLVYAIEGAAKSVGYLVKGIGHLSQQATHHCCDHAEPQVREPNKLTQAIAASASEENVTCLTSNASSTVSLRDLDRIVYRTVTTDGK